MCYKQKMNPQPIMNKKKTIAKTIKLKKMLMGVDGHQICM